MDAATLAQLLELGMLICFGIAWPVDIARTLRTKQVSGKSVAFMAIIVVGYLGGVGAKLARAWGAGDLPELITVMYAFNAVLVGLDIALVYRYRDADAPPATDGG